MKSSGNFNRVAVIGGGMVGSSFAVVFARAGLDVRVYNNHSTAPETIADRIRSFMMFLAEEDVIDSRQAEQALGRISITGDLPEALDGVDYIQECMWEDLELKQDIFRTLTDMTGSEVPIGSSCSGLCISDIVKKVQNHPERCMVAHPTNPPHLIPFMEISGDASSPEAKDRVYDFFESVGQKPIQCKEVYGYVLNRLQLSLIQEALYLVKEDICNVAAVDRALTDGLGLRWAFTGPYGVEELNSENLAIGLDKYKDYMLEFFTREQQTVQDYDGEFIQKCVEGFAPVMEGRTHDEYRLWRDRMVTRARKLKEE